MDVAVPANLENLRHPRTVRPVAKVGAHTPHSAPAWIAPALLLLAWLGTGIALSWFIGDFMRLYQAEHAGLVSVLICSMFFLSSFVVSLVWYRSSRLNLTAPIAS